jgi:PAS domain S-box-containing protein
MSISERERLQQLERENRELKRSEERYALAIAASDQGFWDWDIVTDEIFVSRRVNEIFGHSPDQRYAGHSDFVARVPYHPEDRRHVIGSIRAGLAGSSDRVDFEYRIIPRPDVVRWLRTRWKILRDESAAPFRIIGAVSDITDRKNANDALLRSEERFSLAVAGSSDGIWDWDILSGEMFLSERAQRIYGLEPGPTVRPHLQWRDMVQIHPEDVGRQRRLVDDYLDGKQAEYDGEWRVKHADGSYRWIRLRGTCIRDASGRPTRFAGSVSDIDTRRQAEDALRRSEAYLDEALRLGHAGSFVFDVRSRRQVHWSSTIYEIFDLDPTQGPPSTETLWSRVHPEDIEKTRKARSRAVREKTAYLAHYRVVHRDGSIRHVHAVAQPTIDRDGNAIELVGIVMDVTERRQAEAALRESEERYALAVGGSNDGIFEWDLDTDRVYMSERGQELFGYKPGDLWRPRAEWLAFNRPIAADGRAAAQRALYAYLRGQVPTYITEGEYECSDGKRRWIRMRGMGRRDANGKIHRLAGSLEDITERRRIEEELRSRQEMLELAQKAARAVAFDWRIDARDGENHWSPDLEALYGLTQGTYDGTFKGWKKLVHPEDWPAVREAVQHANETGDVSAEYRVVHPGGVVRWLQAKGKMLMDDERRPQRLIGFMLDVTDRHEAEDELQRLEKQLRQAQRLEAMGTLAGGIAHDFNNILGAILGYGEMALRDAPKGSRLRRDLDNITAAGERGRALVERILAFSRSGVSERVAVNVEKVVHESIDLLTANLPPGISVKAELRTGRAAMQGDPTQVHQVVMNLATNGVQAMATGGTLRVSLNTVSLDSPRIVTTGTVAVGEYILLEVADSGSGIPAKILDRIFDPFFTTKEVGVGTGLGLSLVHGIVTELGGAIDVETVLGSGCLFTVYLPRAGDATEDPEDEMPDLPRGDGQRVLVVDDEEPLVRLATEALEGLGYAPVGFTSSTAALDAFRADPDRFDAVITDERMPRLSGSSLIREMRGIRRKIPILLVSGYLGGIVANRAYNAGANEVLKKPLLARELAVSLARVLHS